MRRRVLALFVLVLVLVAMMAFAALAVAQPPDKHGCNGIGRAIIASEGKQGPPKGRPKIPEFANVKAHPAPRLVATRKAGRELTLSPGPNE
jgi:hypothetical protein